MGKEPIDSSRFGAVVIGIDEYPYYPLHGCVSDANLMEKYFTQDLGVPENRIQLLLSASDEEAKPGLDAATPTRANIIRTLYTLIPEHRRVSLLHRSNPSEPYVLSTAPKQTAQDL
ncbi:hypothetical protein EDD18DRAFT_1339282 [Armillaria luteobubalina]|uniref:Peptidase C14 caspase domain-containing protein n=1 Tax=Armillaria luteobubalina TaxID=153913 RepID=A0AA39NYN7_9AGAR|nr:hypothetical protein EDD18DRAFT_1339282 [Armillaria luteobubalina]